MKLNLIAAAAALALSGAANAAIDSAASGNGELFFTAWDGANSYTFDLNTTIDAFQSGVAAAGSVSSVFNLDSVFSSFIAGANLSQLSWNILAGDSLGARRLLTTFNTLPATTIANDIARNAVTGMQSFVNAVNVGIPAGGNSATFAVGSPGYANNTSGVRFGNNIAGNLNFSNAGTVANNSYDSGLGFMRLDGLASGVARSTYTPYLDEGFAVRAYFNAATGTVTIAAVPEPETFAMLLAGLGLMGAIARRRRQQARG